MRVPLHGGLEPQLAHHITGIPATSACPGGCWYEPKYDGFRALAYVDGDRGIALESRRRKSMKTAFPDIVDAVYECLPPQTVIDGEIVRWSEAGRLDFEALQRRNAARAGARQLARTEPCHYIVFDVLLVRGEVTADRPLTERREALEQLLAELPRTSPVTLGMATREQRSAEEWFEGLRAVGIEGLMVKPGDQPYRPGNRSAWAKVKHFATTEAIVGGVTGTLQRPRDLILGRYSSADGRFVVVGRTTTLRPDAAAVLAPLLRPAGNEHPWPEVLPPTWHGSGPAEYVRTEPAVVVEVRVDVAATPTRWRHGLRYLRPRPDLEVAHVPADLELETGH